MESPRRFTGLLAPLPGSGAGIPGIAWLGRLRSAPQFVSMVRGALLRAATPRAAQQETLSESRLATARRLASATWLTARDLGSQAWDRLDAPLVGPPRFATRKEYRVWKALRATQPQPWNPLQWRLRTWLGIGLVALLCVKSILS